jgi:hypothetical protein
VPYISTNNNRPAALVFCAGLCSAALQSVFFREYLSVFSGNELSIGMILSVWLVCTGAGTMLASRVVKRNDDGRVPAVFGSAAPLALIVCAAAGITAIRASRLLFLPGELLGPLSMLLVLAISELPFALAYGFVLGTLFSRADSPRSLYGWDNAGDFLGALLVYACVLLYLKNALIAAVASAPLVFLGGRRLWPAALGASAVAALLLFDHASVQWKYSMPVHRIVYGHEGEIVAVGTGADTTFLQNGVVYKSTMQKPLLEQAVHIPLGERPHARRALVILDRGHIVELAKYPGLTADAIETEPAFASAASRVISPETYCPQKAYDVIFLGAGIPRSAASNRFYTRSFFLRMKSILTDSGVVTFSVPFSENYLSPSEQRLYDAMQTTLATVFRNVLVFPGEGYTFMASNGPLNRAWNARVPTEYLAASIIPAASEDRVQSANSRPAFAYVNSQNRPITLFLGLKTWMELFGAGMAAVCALLVLCCGLMVWVVPKTRAVLSIATSGLALGAYSVGLLLMYQATYGALYSRVSLLLVALAAGFAIGALVKKFPLSDAAIGLYCGGTLALLAVVPNPPALLFYAFHAGAGVLGGAQIVSRKNAGLGELYAADLFGGAIGMALCSTVLVPLAGIVPVAAGIGAVKIVAQLAAVKRAA